MAQLYYSPVTVNTGQVPSTQTDFPVLVSYTDDRFKTTGNGGHVANANGYDIRPYSDSGLTTALTYELERYNASTGEVIMWVKRSSLADGNVTYLGYGDTTLTTNGSSTATWSNSFGRVWHLKDGTTLSLADSSATGDTLTTSASPPTATTGKIDGAGGLASANSQRFTALSYQQNAITYSCWVNATTFPGSYNYPMAKSGASGPFNLIGVKSTGKMRWMISCNTQLDADGTGVTTLSTGQWYYLVLTYDSSAGMVGYVNGSVDKTLAANGNCSNITQGNGIGYLPIFNTGYWNGAIDEVRMASVARSANWVTTEYNNQSAPSTFATLGTEVSLSVTQSGWFVFF